MSATARKGNRRLLVFFRQGRLFGCWHDSLPGICVFWTSLHRRDRQCHRHRRPHNVSDPNRDANIDLVEDPHRQCAMSCDGQQRLLSSGCPGFQWGVSPALPLFNLSGPNDSVGSYFGCSRAILVVLFV